MAINIIRNPDDRPIPWSAVVIVDDADEAGVFVRPHLESGEEGNMVTVLLFTWDEIEDDPTRYAFLKDSVLYGDDDQHTRLTDLLEPKTFEVVYTFTVEAHSSDEALERINDEGFDDFEPQFQGIEEV